MKPDLRPNNSKCVGGVYGYFSPAVVLFDKLLKRPIIHR